MMTITVVVAILPATPGAAATADTYPWAGVRICGKTTPQLRAAFTVTPAEFHYTLRAKGSRALGFAVETLDRRGGQVGATNPSVIAGDAFEGGMPRLGTIEVRFVVVAAAVYGTGKRRCRVGAVRELRLGSRPVLVRCDPKGTRVDRRLKCRVK